MRRLLLVVLVLFSKTLLAQNTGDLSFIYFNKEEDGFALATWVDLQPNQTIYIRDDKRTAGAFDKTTYLTWNTGASVIPAGSIILFTNSPSVSTGTITMGGGSMGIGNEPLWCFIGTDQNTPATFLAAIGNGADAQAAFGDLSGTGLVSGQTAFRLIAGTDRAKYTGPRGGFTLPEYKTKVIDAAHWQQKADNEAWDGAPSVTPSFTDEVVTIPAKISFAKEYTIVKENGTSISIELKITGANANTSSANVKLTTGFGTAVQGTDFTYASEATISFAANAADNSIQKIEIPVTNGAAEQNDRYFAVELTGFTNAEAGSISKQVIYIQDVNKKGPAATKAIELKFTSSFKIPGLGTAEIVAYDSTTQHLYALNSTQSTVEVLDFANTHHIQHVKTLDMSSYGVGATSVAVRNGIVAATVTNDAEANGYVVFFNTAGDFLKKIEVGNLPDMVTFTPDGKYVLTANEGQPNADYTVDPEGSISMIDISGGIAGLTQGQVSTLTFHEFDSQREAFRTQGIRIYGANDPSVSEDFEPEYITVSKDSKKAWVTLQENNAIAELDLVTKSVKKIYALGLKDYMNAANAFDQSDKTTSTTFANFPVKGMYQPDAIANYIVNGTPYLITANEGDDRAYGDFEEKVRVKDASYVLDPARFPQAALLKKDYVLGRLNVTNATGDTDGDGDFDEIHALGARSFAIWNGSTGSLVFESGDQLERLLANDPVYGATFNANSEPSDGVSKNVYKDRSDDKGPEPEGVTTASINGKQYAFVALERMSGVVTYDVTNPQKPAFVQYINSRSANVGTATGDLGPEGIIYISPQASPSDTAMIVVANEHSATVSVYTIKNVVKPIVLGIESPREKTFSAYPNPVVNNELYFSEPVDFELISLQGKVLKQNTKASHEYVGDLPNGLYLIRTTTGETQKIIIKR